MSASDERRKQALVAGPIRRIQRRLNQELWIRALVLPAWAAVTLVAVYRLLVRSGVWIVAPLALVVAAVAASLRMRRSQVSAVAAAAMADRAAGAGGLLLTRLEVPVGAWELDLNDRVRRVPAPKVDLLRPLLASLAALAFLAVVLAIPLPPPLIHAPNAVAAAQVSELSAKAAALAREQPLGNAVDEELARLRTQAEQGRFTPADWAAADAVKSALDAKAQQAQDKLARAQDAAKQLEDTLQNATSSEAEQREREELERALTDLSSEEGAQGGDAADTAHDGEGNQGSGERNGADGNKSGAGSGSGGGKRASNDGAQNGAKTNPGSKPGQQGQSGKTASRAGEKPGSSSSSASAKSAAQGGKRDISQLRKALADRQRVLQQAFGGRGSPRPGSQLAQNGSSPGSGSNSGKEGTGRPAPGGGGRSKPLRFGEPAPMNPDRLGFAPLPQGRGGEGQELWGLKAADPKPGTDEAHGGGTGAVATGDQAPAAATEALLPRNRALVRRYFESTARR